MDIVLATDDDLPAICRLAYQINTTHSRYLPQMFKAPSHIGFDKSYWKDAIHEENGICLVARVWDKKAGKLEKTEVIGFVTAVLRQNTSVEFLQKHVYCRVGTLVIDEQRQREGVGGKLMAAVEKWARANGAMELRLDVMQFNEGALQFYQHEDYQCVSHLMSKSLHQSD
ncbi:dTDP-fucosamine acetyltransferase [Thalassocella blandensis]|nr:dTDP-fucosamine acetyltransferase [Thalassocella blandensis]